MKYIALVLAILITIAEVRAQFGGGYKEGKYTALVTAILLVVFWTLFYYLNK